MNMKLYIAGKITGDKNFAEKFKKVQTHFEELGYIVFNPAELPAGMAPGDYMRVCLSMIDSSDTIYMLPDYLDSKGAQIELMYAKYIGKHLRAEY